jgi:hypothetical protein
MKITSAFPCNEYPPRRADDSNPAVFPNPPLAIRAAVGYW